MPGFLHHPHAPKGVGTLGEGKAGESSPLQKSKKGNPRHCQRGAGAQQELRGGCRLQQLLLMMGKTLKIRKQEEALLE